MTTPHGQTLTEDIADTRQALDQYQDLLSWLQRHALPQPTRAWLRAEVDRLNDTAATLRSMARTFGDAS